MYHHNKTSMYIYIYIYIYLILGAGYTNLGKGTCIMFMIIRDRQTYIYYGKNRRSTVVAFVVGIPSHGFLCTLSGVSKATYKLCSSVGFSISLVKLLSFFSQTL
jgi:hypothetical protein